MKTILAALAATMAHGRVGVIAGIGLVGAASMTAAPASAAIVFDGGATGASTRGFTSNIVDDQNYLLSFTLTGRTTLSALDFYSSGGTSALNKAVIIKIRASSGTKPATTNLFRLESTIGAIEQGPNRPATNSPDYAILNATITGVTLDAGTYWIGMTRQDFQPLNLMNFGTAVANRTTQFSLQNESTSFGSVQARTFGFRVYGDVVGAPVASVPEPASWTIMIVGFAGIGGAMRRRRMPVRLA